MAYLLDTNVLIRLVVRVDPNHALIRTALRTLRQRGEERYYTSQNLVEFWNVCTRPATARGGYGLTVSQTDYNARLVERVFTLLPDNAAVPAQWRRLVVQHAVQGVQVHDARLVAFMKVYRISHVLTLDSTHFARYPGITAVHPQDV